MCTVHPCACAALCVCMVCRSERGCMCGCAACVCRHADVCGECTVTHVRVCEVRRAKEPGRRTLAGRTDPVEPPPARGPSLGPGPAGNSGTAGPQGPQQQGTPRPSKASCPGPLAMGTHSLWDAGQVPPRGEASHKQGATGPGKCGQCSSVTRARNQGPGPGVPAAAPCHVQATSLPH